MIYAEFVHAAACAPAQACAEPSPNPLPCGFALRRLLVHDGPPTPPFVASQTDVSLLHVDHLPQFGRFASCRPDRRCLGCEDLCATEVAPTVVPSTGARTATVVLFVVGQPGRDGSGTVASVHISRCPALSGLYLPLMTPQGVVLLQQNGRYVLRLFADGVVADARADHLLWLPPRQRDRLHRAFLLQLAKLGSTGGEQ